MTDFAAILSRPVRVRNGDPSPMERLERKSSIDPDGCWTWRGTINSRGYGCIALNGVTVLVHRLSYFLANGDIADDAKVDHECHNRDTECAGGVTCAHRRCWRPDHLAAVTTAENNHRAWSGRPQQMHAAITRSAHTRKARAAK